MNDFLDWLYRVIELLKPKYYNSKTSIVLSLASALITQPLWTQLFFNFTLFNGNDPYYGILLVILALTYNTIHRWFELKHTPVNKPAHEIITKTVFDTFDLLSQNIFLIIKDNEYVFSTFGPNSGKAYSSMKLRRDLTIWNQLKVQTIIPNNNLLLDIIESNQARIPSIHVALFNRMKSHLLAFKAHVDNPNLDYTDYQFPQEFPKMIISTCFSNSRSNKRLKQEKKWLYRKLLKLKTKEAYFFGSIAIIPEMAFDTDIVLIYEENERPKVKLDNLKERFRLRFKRDLHVTDFISEKRDEFQKFIDLNEHKIEIIYG